jgi:type IV secretion system protein VirB9
MSGSRCSAQGASIGQWMAVGLGFGIVLVSPARGERTPAPGLLDPRVRSVPYEPDQVVRLTGQVGFELELVFEPGERFAGLASGDLTGVDFTAQDEHLFLKPRAAGVVTNLTVLTDRRVYRFSYSIVDARDPPRVAHRAPSEDGLPAAVVWSVRFIYPPKPQSAPKETAAAQPLNERYQFCGARQLKPRRVFDDGVRTTIEFGDDQELPAVFVRNPDGRESLVNFTATARGLIVHRVVDQLVLRRGSLTGCLRNRGLAGGTSPEGGAAHRSPAEGAGDRTAPVPGAIGETSGDERGGVDKGVPPAGAAGLGGE